MYLIIAYSMTMSVALIIWHEMEGLGNND